ncbi:hypothetical protein M413DRAFT_408539 [Hebeloma cylindrosporum]|uniref:DUF3533 domain-containing protein n=1 Tax=Hebeloma cylindrosporum TaxID=76867 RepID=A0A0C3CEM4_HEBCY|nr:hypothetical protein M413DRAFT_408539 [Hebeloma cylindrosporum h7]
MADTTDSNTAEFDPSSPPPSSTIANASVFTKNEHDIERAIPPDPEPELQYPVLFSKTFCQRGDPEVKKARMVYLRSFLLGLFMVVLAMFSIFSIYWGSLWKIPAHPLEGWIVDFDEGVVGQAAIAALPNSSIIAWRIIPGTEFPGGVSEIMDKVKDDQTWIAVAVNQGASSRLEASIVNPDPSYNGADAITVYAAEARNENAYRALIRPFMQTTLDIFALNFATQLAPQLSSAPDIASLLSTSPQTVVSPVSYTIVNLLPFDQPVASAVAFVGLIYCLILTFFVVMIAYGAREESGINKMLTYRSLVIVRLVTSTLGYLALSFCYTIFNLAFKLNIWHRYGSVAFLLFWMLNWVGMCSVGLALEAVISILTPKYVPFFLILWIIVNVSVSVYPIDVLPRIYHYGYAAPFYNVSNSIRSLVFGTRNILGLNFGVLIAWVVVSCITLPFIQLIVRRKQEAVQNAAIIARRRAQEKRSPVVR